MAKALARGVDYAKASRQTLKSPMSEESMFIAWNPAVSLRRIVLIIAAGIFIGLPLGIWGAGRVLIAAGVEIEGPVSEHPAVIGLLTVVTILMVFVLMSNRPSGHVVARFDDDVALVSLSPWRARPTSVRWFERPVPATIMQPTSVMVGRAVVDGTNLSCRGHRRRFPRMLHLLGHGDVAPDVA